MAYASPQQLRERYRVGLDGDEFAARDDADLAAALRDASDEIDSWRPAGDLTQRDSDVLAGKVYPLARERLYKDHALAPEHPVRADAAEARRWLRALAAGDVKLPGGLDAIAVATEPALVAAPAEVFGADFRHRHGRRA